MLLLMAGCTFTQRESRRGEEITQRDEASGCEESEGRRVRLCTRERKRRSRGEPERLVQERAERERERDGSAV